MQKRSSKGEGTIETALRVMRQAAGDATFPAEPTKAEISSAAAALGRRGGLKGGPARAAKLSAAKRKAIAKKAASARWGQKTSS
jgi:hypothetical protein